MKSRIWLKEAALRIMMVAVAGLMTLTLFAQPTGQAPYLPQITLTATNGFGPYIAGHTQQNKIIVSSLPKQTSQVMMRFIDADSVLVGTAFTKQGTAIDSAAWNISLQGFNMPLSPRLHVQLTYKSDSVANYFVPYTVYPDTVNFQATKGWGPFITNNYTFTDTSWHNVPQNPNTFKVKHLPPRTKSIKFRILKEDNTVFDSLVVNAAAGHYLDSAVYPNVRMDNLPLSTRYLQVFAFCEGFPDQGLEFHKILDVVPHPPRLTSKSSGITLADSIPACIHNPVNGQALMVDSIKHAEITNGPGSPVFGIYRGPYSFDVITGDFTIEAWLQLDLANIAHNNQNEQDFIHIDSVFSITYVSEYGGNSSAFRLYAIADGTYYQLFEAQFNNSLLQGKSWHHFAFCLEGQVYHIHQFYLDGNAISTNVDEDNITYIQQNINYTKDLRTKPLLLGGFDPSQHSYVKAFDEVRIWRRILGQTEISRNMHQKVLQDVSLSGYWDFDDMRNRLSFVSDESFNNNTGMCKNGATFIPENPDLFTILDTLIINTSIKNADSIKFSIVNQDGETIDSTRLKVSNSQAQRVLDVSALPYSVSSLKVGEMCTGSPNGGFNRYYSLKVHAPAPVATPQCNWGTYYYSWNDFGTITNPIIVNGLPDNTTKVDLGLMSGNSTCNVDTYTINSVPYQYSLNLNGTDNYIKTSQELNAPVDFEVSLWFKTNTTAGGMLIGFFDNQDGNVSNNFDRMIEMKEDGSIVFWFHGLYDTIFLHGSNKYNDGLWHCVTASVSTPNSSELYIDGCMVDKSIWVTGKNYQGYWVVGRYNHNDRSISKYFQGALAYINIYIWDKEFRSPVDYNLINGAHRGNTVWMLDEGTGTQIHDSQGSNSATLMGTTQNWTKSDHLSMVRWEHNMTNLQPGTYTFFAKVYYAGGGEQGVYYPLGNYNIAQPFTGVGFGYSFANGIGYFNQGVNLYNLFTFETDYSADGNAGWISNCLRYYLISPNHQTIDHNIYPWIYTGGIEGSMAINMGNAPPGSYITFQIGYMTHTDTIIEHYFSVPILIRPMLAPTISGDVGPFEQAIAPGTMKHDNMFIVSTEGLSAMNKMTAVFSDAQGNVLASADGVRINNSTWNITQNMAVLSPPETYMNISYYLGSNNILALVAGPYKIAIHRTRPGWFDAIGDNAFSNIKEYADSVTFQVSSPFEGSYLINNSTDCEISEWIPLIGGTESSMEMPTAKAYLKYIKSQSKLVLDQPPDFFQKVLELGAGNPSSLSFEFNYSQNNTYELDDNNNLIATQNFSTGGSLNSGFEKFESLVKSIQELIKVLKIADPNTVIVSPTLSICYTGSFQYSSRLRLMVDSLTGKWGSFGNLNVCADPAHPDAYKNSSSFHFYAGSAGLEFSIGLQLLDGVVSGNFGIDGRFILGFGHSYVTIPSFNHKLLRSFAFQTYGRFYIDVLWGWYEKTLWGPKMFYSGTLWGDDMTDVFPPANLMGLEFNPMRSNSSLEETSREIIPVSAFSKMPLPHPQASVCASDKKLVYTWLERGSALGERALRRQCLDLQDDKFLLRQTIETNDNALNNPSSGEYEDTLSITAWAHSRYDDETFGSIGEEEDFITEFVRSQDIWYAVYDAKGDSVIQTGMIDDEILTMNDGRAEANPQVAMLSGNSAVVTWQVLDMGSLTSDIWYSLIGYDGSSWTPSIPQIAFAETDVESQVKLAAVTDGTAVLVWKKTTRDPVPQSTLLSSNFDGTQWSVPELVSVPTDILCNYSDIEFNGEHGALAYTTFIEDTATRYHEKLRLVPWVAGHFRTEQVATLLTDSADHLQLPSIALFHDGSVAVAVKKEHMAAKSSDQRISQVDILKGDMHSLHGYWQHVAASPYICDTTRQVSELILAFMAHDTLILLSQEYPMLAANASFEPLNGVIFGDPYMNQVLRSFAIFSNGTVEDVDEQILALGFNEPVPDPGSIRMLQCYPNPCLDRTTLQFNLAEKGTVIVALYDLQGRQVATFISQELGAGGYEMNLNTASLEPDTYILQVQAGDSARSLKLIVGR
jgi:hypothetical protein